MPLSPLSGMTTDLIAIGSFDNVMFDINPLLHRAIYSARSENQLMLLLFAAIEHVLKDLGSRQMRIVGLFVDGPAPLAKLDMQRRRRYSSLKKVGKGKRIPRVHPALLTAGSGLMERVSMRLREWSRARLSMDRHKHTLFVCSGHDVPGEAESKMVRCLVEHVAHEPPSRVLLVGGDADLLVAGACAKGVDVFVLREGPDGNCCWGEGVSSFALRRDGDWSMWGVDGELPIPKPDGELPMSIVSYRGCSILTSNIKSCPSTIHLVLVCGYHLWLW